MKLVEIDIYIFCIDVLHVRGPWWWVMGYGKRHNCVRLEYILLKYFSTQDEEEESR